MCTNWLWVLILKTNPYKNDVYVQMLCVEIVFREVFNFKVLVSFELYILIWTYGLVEGLKQMFIFNSWTSSDSQHWMFNH